MSPKRTLVLALACTAFVGLLAGCSSSDGAAPPTTRAQMTFQAIPVEATRLGVCTSFTTAQVQKLLGGDRVPPALPEAITESGGSVTGESCSWELTGTNKATKTLRIEARDYGTDTAALTSRFDQLKEATTGAEDMPGVPDAAFQAASKDTAVVQVRLRQYLLTATSRGTGTLDPLSTAELGIVLGTTFANLP